MSGLHSFDERPRPPREQYRDSGSGKVSRPAREDICYHCGDQKIVTVPAGLKTRYWFAFVALAAVAGGTVGWVAAPPERVVTKTQTVTKWKEQEGPIKVSKAGNLTTYHDEAFECVWVADADGDVILWREGRPDLQRCANFQKPEPNFKKSEVK